MILKASFQLQYPDYNIYDDFYITNGLLVPKNFSLRHEDCFRFRFVRKMLFQKCLETANGLKRKGVERVMQDFFDLSNGIHTSSLHP